ncbi:conserved hypothetical protein [Coccidioides posadasii str. Silveira]|uniref:Uncharacterized protein n=1 Tax=Coccidioides posadasii (strain RMSCC 757 / Silveira) TaxID=443226 RepID=E9DAA3_COCPS|nr:conserved hypothetical protein [Coccidioides posadasii str. Silveira]
MFCFCSNKYQVAARIFVVELATHRNLLESFVGINQTCRPREKSMKSEMARYLGSVDCFCLLERIFGRSVDCIHSYNGINTNVHLRRDNCKEAPRNNEMLM